MSSEADIGILVAAEQQGGPGDGAAAAAAGCNGNGVTASGASYGGGDNEDEDLLENDRASCDGNNDTDMLESSDDDVEEDIPTTPTKRWDVYNALESATIRGSECAADKASCLPPLCGLKVTGLGNISLPINDGQAKQLKQKADKVEDGSYHKVFEVDARKIKLQNPSWDTSLDHLVEQVAYKLGVNPLDLSAELDMLLYMEKGSSVDRCIIDDDDENVLGVLMIQLPSIFEGGEMNIYNGVDEDDSDTDDDESIADSEKEEETVNTFDFGAHAAFGCHFVCHYSDCEWEIAKVSKGARVLLRYSLHYNGSGCKPSANLLQDSMLPLGRSLGMLPRSDRLVVVPMKVDYNHLSLAQNGINAISDHDNRTKVEAIKAASNGDWEILFIDAKKIHTRVVRDDYDSHFSHSSSTFTFTKIFDEEGRDLTTSYKWLGGVVKLTSAEDDARGGMMLGRGSLENLWGKRKSRKTSGGGGGYGYGYNSDGEETTKTIYTSTLALAFDKSCMAELKSLQGMKGVAEVARNVVATNDYGLFERLLTVVRAREKAVFDVSSCHSLLQMLTRAKGKISLNKNDRIQMATRTLAGLSKSLEPDSGLYKTILSAVDKFGFNGLSASIAGLLAEIERKSNKDLSLFLRRADFILKLKSSGNGEANCLENCVKDIATHATTNISNSSEISTTILSMIDEHGWLAMESVVKSSILHLENCARASPRMHHVSLDHLLDRSVLLKKLLHSKRYPFVQDALAGFAKDLAAYLLSSCNKYSVERVVGRGKRETFLDAMKVVTSNGTKEDLSKLGKFWAESEASVGVLLKAVAESDDTDKSGELLLDLFNKCLVQTSAAGDITRPSGYTRVGWPNHKDEDGNVIPSAHIRKLLEAHPELAKKLDKSRRNSIHYAVDSSGTSFSAITDIFEANPKAASVCDPNNGLYPFMVAGSNGNVDASFNLLLADPSLVISGIQEDNVSSKKRKRSLSMGGRSSEHRH